jgi:hypothetical protein
MAALAAWQKSYRRPEASSLKSSPQYVETVTVSEHDGSARGVSEALLRR